MASPHDDLLQVLSAYMSPILARSVLSRSLRRCGLTPGTLERTELRRVAQALETGSRLFVDPGKLAQLQEQLRRLSDPAEDIRPVDLPIHDEDDIGEARRASWSLCDQMGADRFARQKLTTIVSELARNLVHYAREGRLQIRIEPEAKRAYVTSTDSGPGIPNLEEIMSGRYRSKTGLGAGLRGIKRLSLKFDIDTKESGTRVEAEVQL